MNRRRPTINSTTYTYEQFIVMSVSVDHLFFLKQESQSHAARRSYGFVHGVKLTVSFQQSLIVFMDAMLKLNTFY